MMQKRQKDCLKYKFQQKILHLKKLDIKKVTQLVKPINIERSRSRVFLLSHGILHTLKLIETKSPSSFLIKLILDRSHFSAVDTFLNHYFVFHYKSLSAYF